MSTKSELKTLADEAAYPLAPLAEPDERENVEGNSETEEEALELVGDWWDRDSTAKSAVEHEFAQIYLAMTDQHWDLDGPTGAPLRSDEEKLGHPNAVESVIFSLIEGMLAEFTQDVELIDYPSEANDEAAAKTITRLKRSILDKNAFATKYTQWGHHFGWYGTAIWGPRWDPEWKGGKGPNQWVGDIRIEAVHPQLLFPDHRCGENIHDGYRIHKAVWRPLEYIRQHYPARGHLVLDHTKVTGIDTGTIDWDDTTPTAPDGMARLVETWYIGKPLLDSRDEGDNEGDKDTEDDGVGLHVIWWVADQNLYLDHRNYMYFDPEETVKFPFIWAVCYPREDSPWGYSEAHKLLNPQIQLNKLSEIAMEGAALQALGFTVASQNSVSERQQREIELFSSIPGMWFFVDDPQGIKYFSGQGVPGSLLNDILRRTRHMETMIGRFDITQGKAPSSVTAFSALNLLAERAQVRLRPKEQAREEALVELSQWLSRLIVRFYDEPRAYRIIGKDDQDIERGIFQPDEMWRVWDRKTGNVMERNRFVPAEGMVEGDDYEYFCPEFDSKCTVSRAQPTDRFFFIELAKEMVGAKLWPPRLLHFAMEHGRLPAWPDIEKEVEALFGQASPVQPRPPEGGSPEVAAPEAPQEIDPETLIAMLPPAQQQQLAGLPPQQRQEVIGQMMAAVQGGPPSA
uniref:Portal protein n=1 Tax=viral metagenome TaxID=1070528 RepID=A0A6M3IEM0_9ZZZZ